MAIITVSISDNQREDMKDHLEPGQSMSGLIRNLITDWIDRKNDAKEYISTIWTCQCHYQAYTPHNMNAHFAAVGFNMSHNVLIRPKGEPELPQELDAKVRLWHRINSESQSEEPLEDVESEKPESPEDLGEPRAMAFEEVII